MSTSPSQIGLEYASHWFEYHASQRQDVFKMFFLVCAGVISCSGFLLQYKIFIPLMPLGVLMAFFSILFWMLDKRSRTLVEIGERTYIYFWHELGLEASLCPPLLAAERKSGEVRYKSAYLLTFAVAFVAGIIIAGYGAWKVFLAPIIVGTLP
ncbi:hypothetical protein [Rhizobium sp. A37_96]